jgi:hypothetical protein
MSKHFLDIDKTTEWVSGVCSAFISYSPIEAIKEEKRKRKKIDRICWKRNNFK